MMRYINFGDEKGRNAEIVFSGKTRKSAVKVVTPQGEPVKTLRVLKGGLENSYDHLLARYNNDEAVAREMIKDDPEISLDLTGRFVTGSSKLYVDKARKPVFRINKKERVYLPDGSLKEERPKKELVANLLAEFPVRPTGKLYPRKEMATKLVFAKKYQLAHVNGLTFDFLMEIAKHLHEKGALMMLGGGPKGNEPLVFQDGGKGYRAFLEGRVKDAGYILLMHLSNLELKTVSK